MDILKDFKMSRSSTPKYLQIVDCFMDHIARGNLKEDERVPSINEFSRAYNVSRDTVEKSYKVLREKKVIKSIIGKGTYIGSVNLVDKKKVLFLINKLSSYKLEMYNSFCAAIGSGYHTDFEIYNCDEVLFRSLMDKHHNSYDYYIIMPHFKNRQEGNNNFSKEALELIQRIEPEKLIIMDNNELRIEGDIIEIFQDFENDIYDALSEGWGKIKKYRHMHLVIKQPHHYSYLHKIQKGFVNFCREKSMVYTISNKISEDALVGVGDLFIVIKDDDLVRLFDLAKAKNFVLGKDMGIISYDETPLKRLLEIAVVSTNFSKMGEMAADMIINSTKGRIKNAFKLIDRSSL